MWCDSHCHLNFEAFATTVDEAIAAAESVGVTQMVVVGTTIENSHLAVTLSQRHDSMSASVGLHPHHVARWFKEKTLQELEMALENVVSLPGVVAVGETGFDKHVYVKSRYGAEPVEAPTQELQRQVFELQWRLAAKWQKTVILHSRQAAGMLAGAVEQLLTSPAPRPPQVVLHCCEPDFRLLELARRHHCWIGLDGDIATDPTRTEFARQVPLELMLLETDAPYLSFQGSAHRSQPSDIPQIAQHLVHLGVAQSLLQLESQLWLNAQAAFSRPDK